MNIKNSYKEDIYKRYKHGGNFKNIAKDYNVSVETIKEIIEDIINQDSLPSDKKFKFK